MDSEVLSVIAELKPKYDPTYDFLRALENLGIEIEDGMLRTNTASARIKDIQAIEMYDKAGFLGYMPTPIFWEFIHIYLSVHGKMGNIVLIDEKRFRPLWRGNLTRDIKLSKLVIERLIH